MANLPYVPGAPCRTRTILRAVLSFVRRRFGMNTLQEALATATLSSTCIYVLTESLRIQHDTMKELARVPAIDLWTRMGWFKCLSVTKLISRQFADSNLCGLGLAISDIGYCYYLAYFETPNYRCQCIVSINFFGR